MTYYRTFPFVPNFVVEYTPEHRVNITDFENPGKEQVYWKGQAPRQWKLTFTKKYAEIHQIMRWWDNQHGPAIPFYWDYINPLNNNRETILVRFIDTSPNMTSQGTIAGEVSLGLREVTL